MACNNHAAYPKGSVSAQLEEEDQRGIQLKQVDLETDC